MWNFEWVSCPRESSVDYKKKSREKEKNERVHMCKRERIRTPMNTN